MKKRLFFDLIFPPEPVCSLCGADHHALESLGDVSICTPCRNSLFPGESDPLCPGCLKSKTALHRCMRPLLNVLFTAGWFSGPMRLALHCYKFQRRRTLVTLFAARLAAMLKKCGEEDLIQGLVPVPTTRHRLSRRGFNPAEDLARSLSKRSGLPVRNMLFRRKEGREQKSLGRRERRRELAGTYALRASAAFPRGASLAVVDDIRATGSTLRTCASVLLNAGARRVDGIVIAVTPE